MSNRGGGPRRSRGGRGGGRGDGYSSNGGEDGWGLTSGTPRETPNPSQNQPPSGPRGGRHPASNAHRGTPNPSQSQPPRGPRGRRDPTSGSQTENLNPTQSQSPTRGRGGWNPTSDSQRGTLNPAQNQSPTRGRSEWDPTSGAPRGPRGNLNPFQSPLPTRSSGELDWWDLESDTQRGTLNPTQSELPIRARGRGGFNQASDTQRGILNPHQSLSAYAPNSGRNRGGGGNVLGNDAYTPGSQTFNSESSPGRGNFDRQHGRGRSNPSRGINRGNSYVRGGAVGGTSIFWQGGEVTTPDPRITEKEDENIRLAKEASTKTLKPTLAEYLNPPPRSGYGEKQFVLWTNYFEVELDEDLELFKYDVNIEPLSEGAPELQNRRKRHQFFNMLFDEVPDFQRRRAAIATDYANTLVSRIRLFAENLPEKLYRHVYHGEYEQARGINDPRHPNVQKYLVTVKPCGTVPISEIFRYIRSQPTDASEFTSRQDVIHALNIIVAGTPNKDTAVFQSGQNKFYLYPRNGNIQNAYQDPDLGGCLIAVRGYYSSIRTSTSRILLNVNAQCSPFYPEINMHTMMERFRAVRRDFYDLEDFINRLRVRIEYTNAAGKLIVNVMTVRGFSHPWVEDRDGRGQPKLYEDNTIKMKGTKGVDHDWGTADTVNFDMINPVRTLTVTEYFRNIHQVRLEHPGDPVLNCGTHDSPIWIPPEICTVMPGQPYRGILNDLQTSKMLNFAARPPAENASRITDAGLQVIGIKPKSQTLHDFGVDIGSRMLSVHARRLNAPQIYYDKCALTPELADWNMIKKSFFRRVPNTNWSRLNLSRWTLPEETWSSFRRALRDCGMDQTRDNPHGPFEGTLRGTADDAQNDAEIKRKMQEISTKGVGILLVILPAKSAPIYARVKFWADCIFGIHTVCVVRDKISGAKMTYLVNVAHKLNLKLGGINHKLPSDALGILDDGDTMVVGVDVTHPTSNSMENSPSIVGMVASTDNIFAQWPGNIRIQESRQEIQKRRQERKKATGGDDIPPDKEDMVNNIDILLRERLRVFETMNKKYPRNILIYRDGVSEGQYQAILELELKPMKEMCAGLYRAERLEPPKITIVIVGKRHHTRFYPTDENDADKKHGFNPFPGTVVDRGITMQKGFDFYLQAHAALKGTAKPAHYVVIHDDIKMSIEALEKITHNLSYLYERATKAVSYCPPAYYADRLCERGRCYLMKYVSMRGKPPGTKFDPEAADVPWRSGVHESIANSMFYI